MRKIIPFFVLILCASELSARQRAQGYCEQGGKTVVTGGLNGTPRVQGSYPGCTVTVYLTGTLTLATIYSDNSGTVLANPFTANATTGLWYWYADNGRYDVRLSGGGIAAPFTIGDILLADGAGSTSVSSITAGAGISVNQPTGAVTVTNTWGAVPSGSQTQQLQIQPNTGNNTTYQWASKPIFLPSDYDFTPQAPGGSLTGGIANTVTLTPCPLGVNGSDVGHYLRVFGGVGTAETALISGGTCTSGAASGTVVITPANNHSGAWTIGPHVGGIQEAIVAATSGATVHIPAGTYAQYGPQIYIDKPVTIVGDGESTVIVQQTATMNSFYVVYSGASNVQFRDLKISYTTAGTKTAGSGIVLDAPVGLVNERTVIERVVFENQFIGLDAIRAGYWISRDNICSSSNSPNSTCHKVQDLTNADAGDQVVTGLYVGGAATGGVGLRILSGNGIKIHNNKFNNLNGGYVGTGKAISFEGATGYQGAIISSGNSFDQSGTCDICSDGLGTVSDIEIIGNQFNGGFAPVNSSGQINLIAGRVTIAGNTFIPRNAASAVTLTGDTNVVIGNNFDGGSGACVTIGAGSTHNNINANNYLNCTGVTNSSGTALNYIAVQKEGNFLKSTFPGSLEIATTAGQPLIIATDTTPIPHLTGQLLLYAGGSQVTDAHAEAGTCVLGTNCAAVTVAFTNNTSYYCTASDVTSAAAVRIVRNSGVSVTFTGTGTDTLMWMCVGK